MKNTGVLVIGALAAVALVAFSSKKKTDASAQQQPTQTTGLKPASATGLSPQGQVVVLDMQFK